MSAVGWRGWFRRWLSHPSPRVRPRRLCLEPLEDRTLPSATFHVTLLGDAGTQDGSDEGGTSGDLAFCINQVNSDPYDSSASPDTIQFHINGGGSAQTISLTQALPALTMPVIIDGSSQGDPGSHLITIDGGGMPIDGFHLTTGGSTIKDLVIENCSVGIYVDSADGVTIRGNFIGVTSAGDKAANGVGVLITSGSHGAGNTSIGNFIGGPNAGDGNVISGNTGDGVQLSGDAVSGTQVEGNFIGVNAAGDEELGNGGNGVSLLEGTNSSVIGAAGAPNVISGNGGSGVLLLGGFKGHPYGNQIEGNFIGTDITGVQNLGNAGDGVRIQKSASSNTIGGTASGDGNVIAFNAKGVVVVDNSVDNGILGNSIFANAGPGIDLGDDGPTLNGTPGPGPNDFLNHPIITSVSAANGTAEVVGSLHAFASATYRIEFFASPADDPFQGEVFLGSVDLPTDATGAGTFDAAVAPPPFGWRVDATATEVFNGEGVSYGDTSEFSPGPPANPTVFLDPVVPGAVNTNLQAVGHITDSDSPGWTVNVDYGDGTTTQFAAGTTFSLQHAYMAEGSYTITVMVTDEAGVTSPAATEKAEVFIEGTKPRLVGVGESDNGHTTTVSAPGVTSQFTHNGPDAAFLLVTPLPPVATRALALVSIGPDGVAHVVSYDVRGVNLDDQDQVVVQFTYPAGDVAPQLFFFDSATKMFRLMPSTDNPATHTLTVVFDKNSVLPVTGLIGTVFTITTTPIIPNFPVANNAGSAAPGYASTGGSGATGGAVGSVLAGAIGVLTVNTTGVGDGGGGADPSASDPPTVVDEILGDLPTGTTVGGDSGTPPGTAVLSPSSGATPDPTADPTKKDDKKTPMPRHGGPGALRLWLTAPADPMVASTPPGAVQRSVILATPTGGPSSAAPLAVDLALAVGLPLAVAGLRPRKGRRYIGGVLPRVG